jgi:mono/diheme cytochrome c family protein
MFAAVWLWLVIAALALPSLGAADVSPADVPGGSPAVQTPGARAEPSFTVVETASPGASTHAARAAAERAAGDRAPAERASADSAPDAPAHDDPPLPDGLRLLLQKPYVRAEFDDEVFDNLWRAWEEPLRTTAQRAGPDRRRQMAYSYYGLTPWPGRTDGPPLQYVVHEGRWSINCLACHGGKVAGRVIPGAPNTLWNMQTLAEDVRTVKLLQGKLQWHELAGVLFPRGNTIGTTNAVMFGVAVVAVRDGELQFDPTRALPQFTHHDLDAPAWWTTKKKRFLYADASVESNHRALMTFVLADPRNTPQQICSWEDDFREIYRWIQSLEPPRYPFAIDEPLARRGERIFNRACAECHGTYGPGGSYPNRVVPIEVVGTDRVRHDALQAEHYAGYERHWLYDYGKVQVRLDSPGYLAPPLDGIWASAPYFHNGSVPTLWHVLHPEARPVVWRRTEDGYDTQRVGLQVTELPDLPDQSNMPRIRRRFFDTRQFGKSAAGHEFPSALTEEEKRAVLEYLKTL